MTIRSVIAVLIILGGLGIHRARAQTESAGPDGAFWNRHAKRFIYPPAFDLQPREHAASYRFTVRSLTDGSALQFEATDPKSSLAPIWERIPVDSLLLLVEIVREDGGTVPLAERRFLKSPGSSGLGGLPPDPEIDFAAAGYRSLDSLYRSPRVQHWLEHGGPNPDYPLWVYPAKVMSATFRAMAHFSRLTDDPEEAENADRAARMIADFMLGLRASEGSPLAAWPPVHWPGVDPEDHPVYEDEFMIQFPAEAAWALLDLYDVSGEVRYYEAAVEAADLYVGLQRDDGTWFLLVQTATGQPGRRKNPVVPVYMIELFDRLGDQYGATGYRSARVRAFDWIMRNPVQTFAWEAQFEDTRPKPLLENLSYREAARTAKILFRNPETVETAEMLLRFVEDQFVVWSADDPVLFRNWFSPQNRKWNGNDPETGKDWFLPAVLEQYAFYTPIVYAAATVMDAYIVAYQTTGEPEYRQRAALIAESIVRAQNYHGGGEIPTHMRRSLPEKNWTNNGVHAALLLIKHDAVLRR